jgi:hypothetical protein
MPSALPGRDDGHGDADGGSVGGIGLAVEVGGGDFGGVPLVAQGLDDGGADESLDAGAWGVFGSEYVAFAGIERAGEESAEDGGLDAGPVDRRCNPVIFRACSVINWRWSSSKPQALPVV